MAMFNYTEPGVNPRADLAGAGYGSNPNGYGMQDRLMRQARRGNLTFANGTANMDVTGPNRTVDAAVTDPRAVAALEAVQARHTARDNVGHLNLPGEMPQGGPGGAFQPLQPRPMGPGMLRTARPMGRGMAR